MMVPLLFGIPELDRLLDVRWEKFWAKTEDQSASIALLGPDGTGKSVLALHLTSRYYADCCLAQRGSPTLALPKVLYVSTDLRFEKACKIWENFALDIPYERDIPCERASDRRMRKLKQQNTNPIETCRLKELLPESDLLAGYLQQDGEAGIGFIDLASSSAGDDWGYLIRVLSLLDAKTRGHLVVIDSVAGFETLTGHTDSYGERSSRRARIAQAMRATRNLSHLIFVVEESQEGSRLPEEFVADTVIRLRRRNVDGSMRRTLEIEKARARAHAGGEHPYSILDGRGSTTGVWENADEPRSDCGIIQSPRRPRKTLKPAPAKRRINSYVQVYYSLQYRNQRIKVRRSTGAPPKALNVAPFGIKHLDEMLVEDKGGARGLPCGNTCSLIGDAGTGKSTLAHSFLCEAFTCYAKRLVALTQALEDPEGNKVVREMINRIGGWRLDQPVSKSTSGKAISFTNLKEVISRAVEMDEKARTRANDKVLGRGTETGLTAAGRKIFVNQEWIDDCASRFDRPREQRRENDDQTPLRRVQYPWEWIDRGARLQKGCDPIDVADWMLRHPVFARPGVLITTSDEDSGRLAKRFVRWLWPLIEPGVETSPPDYMNKLLNYVAQHLVCRRMETLDATAPLLFHSIEWSIMEAQRLVFGPELPRTQEQRFVQSWRIRVVIDDFRILRDMYPAVRDDPLFLPFLTFYLGREGVTSLIVDTDSGRPDTDPSDETNRELRSLVSHQLFTWEVPFFGQRKVAISSVTPRSARNKGVIREVELQTERAGLDNARPKVDPHFELYSGLEEGKPQAVPLSVRLYEETPAFQEYVRRENLFFRQVFPSAGVAGPGSDILSGTGTTGYEAFRDFCHMPTDLRLDHSLVFQVDGYWSLTREGSLENQYRYLVEATKTKDAHPESMEDPFHLFQGDEMRTHRRVDYFQNAFYANGFGLKGPSSDKEHKQKIDRVPFTWDFGFLLCKDDPWELAADQPLKTMVESILEAHSFKDLKDRNDARRSLEDRINVKAVWDRLPKTKSEKPSYLPPAVSLTKLSNRQLKGREPEKIRLDSWRAFFEAARVVADTAADRLGHPVQPFDFAAMAGDTVSCLVLEIWFSEIGPPATHAAYAKSGRARFPKDCCTSEYGQPDPENQGLIGLLSEGGQSIQSIYRRFKIEMEYAKDFSEADKPKLYNPGLDLDLYEDLKRSFEAAGLEGVERERRPALKGYSLELYRTWLLLLEVLDFSSFEHPDDPFDFRPDRTPVQEAVAARHWYKTACVAATNGERTGHPSELMVACRLPGHYSVRGDWFLATAKGSRSTRLAERALDILSSRRANILRLQAGLGLPTRDVLDKDQVSLLRTALRGPYSRGIIDNVEYGHLFKTLGARHSDPDDRKPESSRDFYWLWRSGMRHYDRHSRSWRKWLHRLFLWTQHYHRQHRASWIGGFKPYDELKREEFSNVITFDSFLEFARMCDLLVAELKASAVDNPDERAGI